MSAATYVGRVGGLAIALGVGAAVFTGQGVAYADDTDSAKPATTSADSGDTKAPADNGGVGADRMSPADEKGGDDQDQQPAAEDEDGADGAAVDEDVVDEQEADESTAVRAGERRKHRDEATSEAAGLSSPKATAVADADADAEATPAVVDPGVRAWLRSPRVAAVREATVAPTTVTTLWTPPETAVTGEDAVVTTTTTAATPVVVDVLTAIDDALNPSSAGGGGVPVGGSVTDLLLLAGTRRELSQQQALDVAPPLVGVTEGVITGCVVGPTCATPDGSTFTIIKDPSKGGKLTLEATTGAFRFLPFAPEQSTNGPSGQETFSILVAQNTQFTNFLVGLPIVGSSLIAPIIMTLQQIPGINTFLAPLIGTATRQDILVDIDALRTPADTPIAYTTFVTSWDGTQISTNFFPAIASGNPDDGNPGYETIFYGPGLAQAGATDPANAFVSTFRQTGYNVVTWDPRGEFASGGVLQLDSPQYEGQDVSELISWAAGLDGVELDGANDPTMGMVGVSYGGGIQFVTAAGDNRVDAIAPGWAWNTLPSSLYPDEAFRPAYSALLLLGLVETGARINPQIYGGILTGASLGILTPGQLQLLQTSGPGQTVRGISAPTLIIQGTVDVLFPLQQSIINNGLLAENENVKLLWYCGGHGSCLPGQGNPEADDVWVLGETLEWMDRFVKDDGSIDDNVFEWTDQDGNRWTSTVSPTDSGFYDDPGKVPPTVWDTGKFLPIIPLVGGSGPNPEVPLPYSLGDGSVASNAVTIALQNPLEETNVVGAPRVVIEYNGLGTSRHIYAQVVDKSTGLVVGNIVSPVPVTLNGRDQTATIDLSDIAYTVGPDSELELQIFTTATPFFNITQFGYINVQSVEATLPTTTKGTTQGPNPTPPAPLAELVAV